MSDNVEVEITPENFDVYFKDVRKNKPEKGQVMAKYMAVADLIDGRLKRDLIDLLLYHKKGSEAGPQVLRKLGGASDRDSLRIMREMAADLVDGMTEDQVAEKPYKFILEHFFYVDRKFVPTDDPHWSVIEILNFMDGPKPEGIPDFSGQES